MNKKQLLILPALFLSLLISSTACVSLTLHELHRRAEQGDADAQTTLGVMYEEGRGGLAKDGKKAVAWYRLAAEQGHAAAQSNLGLAYDRGHDVPQDYKKALRWYHLSANQGDSYAQAMLGNMHFMGEGVSKDYVRAYMWFKISLENKERTARKIRNIIWKRIDFLEKTMTHAQVEEAQRLAKEWTSEWISAKTEKARELSEKCKAKNYKNC